MNPRRFLQAAKDFSVNKKQTRSATERFPTLFLTVAMLLTGTVLSWLGWNTYESYRAVTMVRERYFRIQELQGVITHLDEVLTMSARMAAVTGDLAWEQRYLYFEPLLDDAINEVIRIEPNAYRGEGADQTGAANIKLVEMEHRAFGLVRQNLQPAAREVLFSAAYETQKKFYSQGMIKAAGQLKKAASDGLRSEQQRALIDIFIVAAALPTLLIGWLVVLRILQRWRTWLSAGNQRLDRQAQDLRELNAGLDKRVAERTAQLEAAHLLESKQKEILQRIFDYIPVMVCLYQATGKVKMVNREFERLLGWSLDDFQDTSRLSERCLDEDSRRRAASHLQDASGEWLDFSVGAPDGSVLASSWASVRLSDGSILGIGQNISDRKRTESELAGAKERAEAGSRAKSEFLANMSHEIRTPLNGVIGMTDLALHTELTPEQQEYLETIRFSADSLLIVINDILDFSKIEAGKIDLELDDFDLRDSLETTLKGQALSAHAKGLELLCEIAPEVPYFVQGDSNRLRQIIVNLVSNAIKFTNTGEVVLSVQVDSEAADDHVLRFTVSDSGIGIPQEKQELIFQPFAQADHSTTRKYGGTGLGLTISSRLVAAMGGKMWVESAVGQGTKFHFTARITTSEKAVEAATISPFEILRGVKVLVVDDNHTNRRILEGMLKRWEMKPTSVESGVEALACLSSAWEAGDPYGLLLTDMHMPEMDGFTLIERIRQRPELSAAIIMMLTSGGHRGDGMRCKELGVAAYLLKPVSQSGLREAMARVLGAREQKGSISLLTRYALQQDARSPAAFLRVLVAEDNPVNQLLATRLLEKRGHRVVMTCNGSEALAALEKGPFDLVLMDVQMPVMDGLEAISVLRQKEKERDDGIHQPVVALTARAVKGDRELCLAAGMDGYLTKPIRPQKLDALLEGYLARRMAASLPE